MLKLTYRESSLPAIIHTIDIGRKLVDDGRECLILLIAGNCPCIIYGIGYTQRGPADRGLGTGIGGLVHDDGREA